MLIIPAIDILNGKTVRLLRGDYAAATVYGEDPAETAKGFEKAGATRIHVVDLDAARGGIGNRRVIRRIRKAVSCEIEVGGGVRTIHDVEELFDIGVDYLILGTVLVKSPRTAKSWSDRFGPRFIAGIDAKAGAVKVSGWADDGSTGDAELAARCAKLGMAAVIYTAIESDGTLEGPDIARTTAIAKAAAMPTYLSGGIGSMENLAELAAAIEKGAGIGGVVMGKAIYENALDLREAVERFGG
jgi:phosphoribosylformimino-5-aminoimidazole carboxamide ribotide isomerase